MDVFSFINIINLDNKFQLHLFSKTETAGWACNEVMNLYLILYVIYDRTLAQALIITM